jgi:hypothetical protein
MTIAFGKIINGAEWGLYCMATKKGFALLLGLFIINVSIGFGEDPQEIEKQTQVHLRTWIRERSILRSFRTRLLM